MSRARTLPRVTVAHRVWLGNGQVIVFAGRAEAFAYVASCDMYAGLCRVQTYIGDGEWATVRSSPCR